MKLRSGGNGLEPALAMIAVVLCCGAPLAVAFVLTTGLGAALLASGWLLAGLALLAAGVVLGVRYLARSGSRRVRSALAERSRDGDGGGSGARVRAR